MKSGGQATATEQAGGDVNAVVPPGHVFCGQQSPSEQTKLSGQSVSVRQDGGVTRAMEPSGQVP